MLTKSAILFLLSAFASQVLAFAGSKTDAPDISTQLSLSFHKSVTPTSYCPPALKLRKEECQDTAIYPVVSGHPDEAVEKEINANIAGSVPQKSNQGRRFESWTEIKLNKSDVISYSTNTQFYSIGSVGQQTELQCSTVDLTSGEKFQLANILKPGFETALPAIIHDNLDNSLGRKMPGYLRNVMKERGSDWKLSKNRAFFVTETDLVLCFDRPALGYQTFGPLTIPVPLELLTKQIDNEGPFSFLLSGDKSAAEPVGTRTTPTSQKDPAGNEKTESSDQPERFSAAGIRNVVTTTTHTCSLDTLVHKISNHEKAPNSYFVCEVEFIKANDRSILWQSTKTLDFCAQKVTKLIEKYETQWGWNCEHTTEAPGS